MDLCSDDQFVVNCPGLSKRGAHGANPSERLLSTMRMGRGNRGILLSLKSKCYELYIRSHMSKWLPLGLLWACVSSPSWATVYELSENGTAVFGADERIKATYQDTLLDLARRYSLGYEEILRANPGVDMWIPGEGTNVLLPGRRILPPGPRTGIVVNLPEHRLYYYPKPKKGEKPVVITFPVSIGKMDWRTPLGETHVISKQK